MASLTFENIYFDEAGSNFDQGDASTAGDSTLSFHWLGYDSPFEDYDAVYTISVDTGDGGTEELVHEDFSKFDLTFSGTITSPDGTTVFTVDEAVLPGYYVGSAADGGIVVSVFGDPTLPAVGVVTDPDTGDVIDTFEEDVDFGGYFLLTDLTYPNDEVSTIAVSYDDPFVLCFAEGTLIATPEGEFAVETLKPGQLVLTAEGESSSVKWLGRQTLLKLFGPAERLSPVVIEAGAFAPNIPHSDLTVTADHAMVLDGALVQAGALVNGDTVRRVPMAELPDRRTVYHIETEGHAVVLANGAASETFIDNVSRRRFDNYAEYVAMSGTNEVIEPMALPRAKGPRQVPFAIRSRLAERAALLRKDHRIAG